MTKVDRVKDKWGHNVVRVKKKKKFDRVPDDVPIFINKSIHNPEKRKRVRIYDIMRRVENYLYNSGK